MIVHYQCRDTPRRRTVVKDDYTDSPLLITPIGHYPQKVSDSGQYTSRGTVGDHHVGLGNSVFYTDRPLSSVNLRNVKSSIEA